MLMNRQITTRIDKAVSVGFALPTVLLASTLMMAVLLLAVQANTAVRAELNSQFYNKQARLATQSGIARAQQCLKENGSVATWTNAKPLLSNTDCSGNIVGGYSAYVYSSSVFRTSFSVPAPVMTNGVQRVSSNGKLELLRTSSNVAWRTYNQTLVSQTGADISFKNVSFGYTPFGSYFATIGIDGDVKGLGYNAQGQLGTGNNGVYTSPQTFQLYGNRASQIFTNFLSQGWDMFVLLTDGRILGAGSNTVGELGNGTTNASYAAPVYFNLPPGVKGKFVTISAGKNFVIGDDNNIYAAGNCAYGQLGNNYTIAGCANKSSYVRVNLPTPNVNDPNTLPVTDAGGTPQTNMIADRSSVYVRMQGGRVYGWGVGDVGLLGQGDADNQASHSSPVQIGLYGNSGQPKAVQIATDGLVVYILDDTGAVNVAGYNAHGELAGGESQIQHQGTGMCLNNPFNSTSPGRAKLYDCLNAVSQRNQWEADQSITVHPNGSTTLCLDNAGNIATNGNPVQWYGCNGSVGQKWRMQSNGSILNISVNKCIDDPSNTPGNDAPLQIYDCNGSVTQAWSLPQSNSLVRVPIPASAGTVTQVVTDESSTLFVTTSGQVWGAGTNERGQLGDGTTSTINPALRKMVGLPIGKKAVKAYTTRNGSAGPNSINTFVILDDGTVWGCGANTYGQLGNGTVSPYESTPVQMSLPGSIAKDVQVGLGTAVVLTTSGAIFTVGNNSNGQLGDGTTTNSSTPKANKYTNIIAPTLF